MNSTIKQILKEYSHEYYLLYSTYTSAEKWGDFEGAFSYLKKYYVEQQEILSKIKKLKNNIFINQNSGFPKMVFRNKYHLNAYVGGVLFDEIEFIKIQKCAKYIGERFLYIVQNDFGGLLNKPAFIMQYPIDITWKELMSGNFVSTALFEMFANDYFVFGDSGTWGKYVANDNDFPLDIVGVKYEYRDIFEEQLGLTQKKILKILPLNYLIRIMMDKLLY